MFEEPVYGWELARRAVDHLNNSQARASSLRPLGLRLESLFHHPSTGSSVQSNRMVMPLENRVHRANSNSGTAVMSGVSGPEAVMIASRKPRPAASRGPKRLTITASTPRLIDALTRPPIRSNQSPSKRQRL